MNKRCRFYIFFAVFVSFLATGILDADVMVKEIRHSDAFYTNGMVIPEENIEIQWWVGKNKITCITPAWQLSLDRDAKSFLVSNLQEKTYLEIPVPITLANHADQPLIERLAKYTISGSFKNTGEKVDVEKKPCVVFQGQEKLFFEDNVFYERDRKLMVTTEVMFDWTLQDELLLCIVNIFHPQPSYLGELKKINGCTWVATNTFLFRGTEIKTSSRIVEMTEKDAPGGIYGVPAGFNKKEKVVFEELRQLRGLVYY